MQAQQLVERYREYDIYREPLLGAYVVRIGSPNSRALEVCDSLDEAKDMIDLRIKTQINMSRTSYGDY